MIAATILLYTNLALGANFGMSTNVVGRFAIIGTFGQPLPDRVAISGRMIVAPASETKSRFARMTDDTLGLVFFGPNDHVTVRTRTKP